MTEQTASSRNVLITGPSRSGTTLTCELLNQLADVVALDEPMNATSLVGHPLPNPARHAGQPQGDGGVASRLRRLTGGSRAAPEVRPDARAACDNVERFLAETRRSITERGVAVSKNVGGAVLGKKVADDYGEKGVRVKLAKRSLISIEKELSAGFLLAVKQTSGFIALLPELVRRFEVYALVRNPLAVITSWQTLPFHPQDGHVRLGEGIDWELRDRLREIPDRIDRQFELLAWCYGRIHQFVPPANVIRYEDLVTSAGRALSTVTPRANELQMQMEDRNENRSVHDRDVVRLLGDRMLATAGPWWRFYSEDSVRRVLSA